MGEGDLCPALRPITSIPHRQTDEVTQLSDILHKIVQLSKRLDQLINDPIPQSKRKRDFPSEDEPPHRRQAMASIPLQ
jgi:hypothetical protein